MPSADELATLQRLMVRAGYLTGDALADLSGETPATAGFAEALNQAATASGVTLESPFIQGETMRRISDIEIRTIIGALARPRCGVPDRPSGGIQIQTFGSPGGRWSRGFLSVSINPAGCNLDAAVTMPIIRGAFMQWQAISPFFTFNFVGANGDIRVSFGGREVDDRFGAEGGVAGSACYPEIGRVFFDNAEIWTRDLLLSVALHEVGHALGLSHSNNPNSIMYPFVPNAGVIEAESRRAMLGLYGWRPQVGLTDRATSDRPALAVSTNVNFTSSSSRLHMAWKGSRDDQGLYVSELATDRWTPQQRLPDRGSSHGPAMCDLPLGNGTPSTGLIMAWKGVRDDQGLYFAVNRGGGWLAQARVPNVGSSDRPALANFNGVRMAWKGVRNDQGIYWSTLTPTGWSAQQRLNGRGTSTSPALVTFRNRLYMFWKGINDDRLVYYSWIEATPNAIWQPQRVVQYFSYETSGGAPHNIGASHGPSATVRGDRILLAWKGVPGDQGIYFSLFDGREFSGQIRVDGVGTSQGPGIAQLGARTHMVWKGIEGDNRLYWSTL